MRFFRRQTAEPKLESWQESLSGPRVENGIVYDEHGEVLHMDEPVAEPDFAGLPDPVPEPEPEPEVAATEPVPLIPQMDVADMPAVPLSVDLPDSTPAVDVTVPEPIRDPSDLLHKRANLSEVRMDVARITSDIQSGERLYQRAQQRVESLMSFVERAEVDFSLLNRLEPENKRLKARNRVLEAESEADKHSQRRLQNELDEVSAQLESARQKLQASESKLGAVTTQMGQRDRELARLTDEMEQAGLRLERTQTTVDVESRENVVLRDQITELSSRIDDVTSERMELAKMVESLKIDCDDFRAQKDQAVGEVSDLRAALATAQKVNGEMKTRMVGLHEEIKSFKTQYEFNVISRDDRILNMEARLADLTKQVRIKDDVAKSALADVAELRRARTAQDVERERLERLIESQQRQLDEANAQIQRSSASMSELDQRYNDVAAALSMHQKRLTPTGNAAPLAPPPPFADRPDSEIDALTPETVEDLITDYKLGLREGLA